jgi:hypothetical protein
MVSHEAGLHFTEINHMEHVSLDRCSVPSLGGKLMAPQMLYSSSEPALDCANGLLKRSEQAAAGSNAWLNPLKRLGSTDARLNKHSKLVTGP